MHRPPSIGRDTAVLLDFDGTLVELAGLPDAVVVDEELGALLRDLIARQARCVAIVSGRSIAQLESFLGTLADDMALIGSHGAEIRHRGALLANEARPSALDQAAILFSDAFATRPGVVVEEKSLGVAIHYRQDATSEEAARAMAAAFARRHGLEVQDGKMMVEVRLPGHDKGSAIAKLMREAPFAGHIPFFAGDDLTDEPGFAVCEALGGAGILVGPQRPSAACFALEDVASVRAWLAGGQP